MTTAEWKLTIDGFEIDKATWVGQGWQVELHPASGTAACPCCACLSSRVHSYYTRTLRDLPVATLPVATLPVATLPVATLPVATLPVALVIRARRFECRNDTCRRQVFCERLGAFAPAYSRMSERLISAVRVIGLALNREGGARLANELGIRVSGDTISPSI